MSQRPKRKSVAPPRFRKNEVLNCPEASESTTVAAELIQANLPGYDCVARTPTTTYNNTNGQDFLEVVEKIYSNTVKWRKNLFQIPSGNAGKAYIRLSMLWLKHFNDNSSFKGIALKVFMILPCLMLQKPSATSKSKDHTMALERRLTQWSEGKFLEMMKEGDIIQKKLCSNKRKKHQDDAARVFSKLMCEGKVRAAIKFIEKNSDCGVLPSTDEVIEQLGRSIQRLPVSNLRP